MAVCILRLTLTALVIVTISLAARGKGNKLGNFPSAKKRNRLSTNQMVASGLEQFDSGIFKGPSY